MKRILPSILILLESMPAQADRWGMAYDDNYYDGRSSDSGLLSFVLLIAFLWFLYICIKWLFGFIRDYECGTGKSFWSDLVCSILCAGAGTLLLSIPADLMFKYNSSFDFYASSASMIVLTIYFFNNQFWNKKK